MKEEEFKLLREQAREWRGQLEVINGRSARLRAIIIRALEQIEQERPLTEMEQQTHAEIQGRPRGDNSPPPTTKE